MLGYLSGCDDTISGVEYAGGQIVAAGYVSWPGWEQPWEAWEPQTVGRRRLNSTFEGNAKEVFNLCL